MSSQIQLIKEKLNFAITQLCKTSWMFVKNPNRNFTRERKLPLHKVISILLCLEGGSLTSELLRYFNCSRYSPSSSALIQQRQKINELAFPALFSLFTKYTDRDRLYKGYRLLAADGSDFHISTDPKHTASYFPGATGQNPYNLLHLDAVYDLIQHTYLDAEVCGRRNLDERGTLCKMVDRSHIANALIIADRGYECYNLMAHVQEKGWKFLIRIKDIHASSGIISALDLPDMDEFDLYCPMQLTRRRRTETIPLFTHKNQYKWIGTSTPLDYLPTGSHRQDPVVFYHLPFRVVRFKLSDFSYETVITNLDAENFPPEELKHLYGMRWGIETSFRELKYTVGLLHFHAKKVENITQEIYAKLIMYNFTELVTSHVIIQKGNTKYDYRANFAIAVHVCRQFLRGNVSPPDVEAIIRKHVSPVRLGRSRPRRMTVKHAISFIYRVA